MRLSLLEMLLKNSDESVGEQLFMDTSTTNVADLYLESLVTSLVDGFYPSNTTVPMPKRLHLLIFRLAISLKSSVLLHFTDQIRAPPSAIDPPSANEAASRDFNKCVFDVDLLSAGLMTLALKSEVG